MFVRICCLVYRYNFVIYNPLPYWLQLNNLLYIKHIYVVTIVWMMGWLNYIVRTLATVVSVSSRTSFRFVHKTDMFIFIITCLYIFFIFCFQSRFNFRLIRLEGCTTVFMHTFAQFYAMPDIYCIYEDGWLNTTHCKSEIGLSEMNMCCYEECTSNTRSGQLLITHDLQLILLYTYRS